MRTRCSSSGTLLAPTLASELAGVRESRPVSLVFRVSADRLVPGMPEAAVQRCRQPAAFGPANRRLALLAVGPAAELDLQLFANLPEPESVLLRPLAQLSLGAPGPAGLAASVGRELPNTGLPPAPDLGPVVQQV